MTDDTAATDFLAALSQRAGTRPLDAAEVAAVLRLTKVVAHASERRFAPLTAYAAALAWSDLDRAERLARIEALTDEVREVGS